MKILLIETGDARENAFAQCWYTPATGRFTVPLLALPVIAGLTPGGHDVRIVDEKVRDIDFDADCDLVCFSYKTKDANRTYRYAKRFRDRGVQVVLGGVHATNAPDEAQAHADAVVVGEAEGVWARVLEDAERGALQKRYVAEKGGSLAPGGLPRFDLIENDRYCMHAIQTSKGCLVGCEFCPIFRMHGPVARHKSVQRVREEIDAVRAIDRDKMIFFVDEMFCGGQPAYQKDLLAEVRRARIDFMCISDFKVISPKYVEDLARSGCRKMSINMPGTCLPEELKAVKAIQRLGIEVWGFFMFGFSFHKPDVFQRVADFARDARMKNLTLTVLTPFPNTPAHQAALARGAKIDPDLDRYDQCHVVFEPEGMSARELEDGFHRTWDALEDRIDIGERTFAPPARWGRAVRRAWGTAALRVENACARLRPAKQPVDLLGIVGRPKVEVSVTTHNTMGGYHAKY